MSIFKTIGSAIGSTLEAAAAANEAYRESLVNDVKASQAKYDAALTQYTAAPGQYSAGDLDRAAVQLMDAGRKLMTANHHWAEPATFNSAVPTLAQQSRTDRPTRSPMSRISTCFRPAGKDNGPLTIRHYDDVDCRWCRD